LGKLKKRNNYAKYNTFQPQLPPITYSANHQATENLFTEFLANEKIPIAIIEQCNYYY